MGEEPGEIELSWDPVSGASGYTVKRSPNSGGSYSAVGTPESPSYTDTGLFTELGSIAARSSRINDMAFRVPEPATLAMLGLGGLLLCRRRA